MNGEDVKEAPRDHVIQLVRACESKVTLVVCQPTMGTMGRKSTFLSAGKKAKLRTRPSRVRFAESVCVNGAPLFPVSSGQHDRVGWEGWVDLIATEGRVGGKSIYWIGKQKRNECNGDGNNSDGHVRMSRSRGDMIGHTETKGR